MPILQNAKKALRASKKKAVFNSRVKSMLKTSIDKVKTNPTKDSLAKAFSRIDKAVKRNLIHKNKASRLKSQLNKVVKEGSKTVTKAKKKTTKAVKTSVKK